MVFKGFLRCRGCYLRPLGGHFRSSWGYVGASWRHDDLCWTILASSWSNLTIKMEQKRHQDEPRERKTLKNTLNINLTDN